jgi:YkoP domain
MEHSRPLYRWAVAIYDRLYRFWFGLDTAESEVGPALRIQVERSRRTILLDDGTTIHRGDPIGVIHLNNEHVKTIHADCSSPAKVGLEFRRQLLASLRELARLTESGGRLSECKAFTATTIFHRGLKRFGFEATRDHLLFPGLVAFYQRALLSSLHPAGRLRLHRSTYARAERLWISRDRLGTLHGGLAPFHPGSRLASEVARRPRTVTPRGGAVVALPGLPTRAS